MATFSFQSFLEHDPQVVADGDTPLYAGPSALLTGLPAVHGSRHDWAQQGDGSRAANDTGGADDRAFHAKAKQGKGFLLLYAADQTLLLKLEVNVLAHSGAPDEREDSALWSLENIKRAYNRYYEWPHNYWRIYTKGLRKGLTLSYPRMYYELEPVADAAAGGLLGSHVLYHTNVKATGTVTSAYLLYTEDAFGNAQADVANDTELATATPEQLNVVDANRPLVWLKLPVGKLPADVVKLTNDNLGATARVLATNSIHFTLDVLPDGREEAAVSALRQSLIDFGIKGYDHKNDLKLAEYQYYMDLSSVYGTMDLSQLGQGAIVANRESSIASMFKFPHTGKFYFEVDLPESGNQYVSLAFVERGTDFGDFDGSGTSGPIFRNYDYRHYPYGTNTLRVLVDMEALSVTFMMADTVLPASSYIKTALTMGNDYEIIVGINSDSSGSGALRLRFADADFLFAKPEGYAAVSTLMAQASSV